MAPPPTGDVVRNDRPAGSGVQALPVAASLAAGISALSEIMPDRCTPEFERMMARMGSLVAYGRVPALMAEFLPVGRSVTPETVRRRTLRVGARLERRNLTAEPPPRQERAAAMTLCVDGGHVKSIRSYA
jgi:hypothetical protein